MLANFSKTQKLILLLLTSILLIVIGAIVYSVGNKTTSTKPKVEVLNREDLKDRLPYRGNNFVVDYSEEDNLYLVQIIQKPYAENKLKAEAWFRSLGFEDLCSLKISWWADRDVLPPEPTDKDFSTTGCSQT